MKLTILKYVGVVALALFATASASFNVVQHRQILSLKSDPKLQESRATEAIIAAARKLMVLPDEVPTIATVTDPEKLKTQSFFASAKNGDKVLIFSQAKKAVLYDPIADKIVEVAPLVNNAQPAENANVNAAASAADETAAPAKQKRKTVNSNASVERTEATP